MRIEHAGESVAGGFWGRQETASVEAARIAGRLAMGPDGATAPAVLQADTVRISAEARAVLQRAAHEAGRGAPLPGEVIAAVRAVVMADSAVEVRTAVERLGAVLRRARVAPPGPTRDGVQAARLLRLASVSAAAMEASRGGSATWSMRAASLVRALTAPQPGEAIAGERLLERAGAALYLAAGRLAVEAAGTEPLMAQVTPVKAGELPAALLSLAGAPERGRRRFGRRERDHVRRARRSGDDGDAGTPGPTEVDREPPRFV